MGSKRMLKIVELSGILYPLAQVHALAGFGPQWCPLFDGNRWDHEHGGQRHGFDLHPAGCLTPFKRASEVVEVVGVAPH